MGLWETMRARTQPKRNNLDALFLVPSAAITLQTAAGFEPTGHGLGLLPLGRGCGLQPGPGRRDRPDPRRRRRARGRRSPQDDFGFTWLVVEGDAADMSGLCTDLHAVNTTLEAQGFESGLLCSMIPFANTAGQRFGLVYLYKQGTFYPFAPTGEQSRDTMLELSVRDHLAAELPMEQDLQRWMALWKAPGL